MEALGLMIAQIQPPWMSLALRIAGGCHMALRIPSVHSFRMAQYLYAILSP